MSALHAHASADVDAPSRESVQAAGADAPWDARGSVQGPEDWELQLAAMGVAGEHEIDPGVVAKREEHIGPVREKKSHVACAPGALETSGELARSTRAMSQLDPTDRQAAVPHANTGRIVCEQPYPGAGKDAPRLSRALDVSLNCQYATGCAEPRQQRPKPGQLARKRAARPLVIVARQQDDVRALGQ